MMGRMLVAVLLVGCAAGVDGSDAFEESREGLIVEGRERASACVECHGADLSGGVTPVMNTNVYAPNLTPDRETGLGSWSDEEVMRAMRDGVDSRGAVLCRHMPRYGSLSDPGARAITAYLRSLQAVSRPRVDGNCRPEAP